MNLVSGISGSCVRIAAPLALALLLVLSSSQPAKAQAQGAGRVVDRYELVVDWKNARTGQTWRTAGDLYLFYNDAQRTQYAGYRADQLMRTLQNMQAQGYTATSSQW